MTKKWVATAQLCLLLGTAVAQKTALPATLALPAPPEKRGREVWAFRSVLDTKPRVLTLALHADLWVAYDAVNGALFKVWKDGVKLTGPVFDQKHGPQPLTKGEAYVKASLPSGFNYWLVSNGNKSEAYSAQFKGYKILNGQVTLTTELKLANNQGSIMIEETPEFMASKEGLPGLVRKISYTAPAGYALTIQYITDSHVNAGDFQTDGKFTLVRREEVNYPWGKGFGLQGRLELNAGKPTYIQTIFEPKTLQGTI